jgi:hypothetical protein
MRFVPALLLLAGVLLAVSDAVRPRVPAFPSATMTPQQFYDGVAAAVAANGSFRGNFGFGGTYKTALNTFAQHSVMKYLRGYLAGVSVGGAQK